MLSTPTKKSTIIRNYLLLVLVVMVMGAGLTEIFQNPRRIGQKDRLDNWFRYINAGFVAEAQKLGR